MRFQPFFTPVLRPSRAQSPSKLPLWLGPRSTTKRYTTFRLLLMNDLPVLCVPIEEDLMAVPVLRTSSMVHGTASTTSYLLQPRISAEFSTRPWHKFMYNRRIAEVGIQQPNISAKKVVLTFLIAFHRAEMWMSTGFLTALGWWLICQTSVEVPLSNCQNIRPSSLAQL